MDYEKDYNNISLLQRRLELKLQKSKELAEEFGKSVILEQLLQKHGIEFNRKIYVQFKGNPVSDSIRCHIRDSVTKLMVLELHEVPIELIPQQVLDDIKKRVVR